MTSQSEIGADTSSAAPDTRAGFVALIGAPNAGKSTLMMTIFGDPRAREGQIIYDGHDITQLAPHEIARLRIAQSPEGRRIFARMTVLENLQMGASIDNLAHFDEDLERIPAQMPEGCAFRQAVRKGHVLPLPIVTALGINAFAPGLTLHLHPPRKG